MKAKYIKLSMSYIYSRGQNKTEKINKTIAAFSMSDFYAIYDSADQNEVALTAYPTNLRIIQGNKEKGKRRRFAG